MKYLSQIQRPYQRIFSMSEQTEEGYSLDVLVGIHKVSAEVTVGSGGTAKTLNLEGEVKALLSSDDVSATFYGLYESVLAVFLDNHHSIASIAIRYTITSPDDEVVHITDNAEDYLFCIDKVTGLTADQYIASHALMSSSFGYFIPGDTFDLQMYLQVSASTRNIPYTKSIYYLDSQGQTHSITQGGSLSASGSKIYELPVPFPTGTPFDGNTVIKVVVSIQNIHYTIYNLKDSLNVNKFRFLNRWNIQEVLTIPCSIAATPKSEFELATCNDFNVKYDIENTTEYKVTTGPLGNNLFNTLLQLVNSRFIDVFTTSGYQPIYVKDFELNKSSEPNIPIKLAMTYEMAYNTPTINLP